MHGRYTFLHTPLSRKARIYEGSFGANITQASPKNTLAESPKIRANLTGPMSSLVEMNKVVQNALIAADRLFEIMDLELENSAETFGIQKEEVGNVSFKEVSFRYGTRANVFEKLSITFPKGKISGVIGESG